MRMENVRWRHDPATGEPSPNQLHQNRPDRRPGGGTLLWPPLRDGSRNPGAVLQRRGRTGSEANGRSCNRCEQSRRFRGDRPHRTRSCKAPRRPEHYALVGSALLWTLEQGLGDEFTPALRAAWAAAYCALSEVMIASAYPGVTASLLTEPIMTQVQSGNGNQASKPFRRQSEPPGFADSNCPRVCKERDEHTI